MFGTLIIGNNFFPYKSHRKLVEMSRRWPWRRWRSKLVSHHGFAKLLCLARFWSLCTSGQQCFCITLKKCQKLYELNEFYSVRRWRWINLTFPQNPDFVVLYSNFVQNQVTAPCNNCLACHVLKDRSSVSILPFFVNSNDTSKIRHENDANRRDKIFQTKSGKKMF